MLKMALLAGALAASTVAALAQTATQPATPARPAAPAATPAAPARPSTAPTHVLIDINSATRAELMTLPGIGEARADGIIRGRPYRGKDDLPNRGIVPQGVYDNIKDRIIARQSR